MSRYRSKIWILGLLGMVWASCMPVTHAIRSLATEPKPAGTFAQASTTDSGPGLPVNPEQVTVIGVLIAWLIWNDRSAKADKKRDEAALAEERKDRRRFLVRIGKLLAQHSEKISRIEVTCGNNSAALGDLFVEVRNIKDCKTCTKNNATSND